MNYKVTGEQLTSIANSIREASGMNLYDPVANLARVKAGVKYVFSKSITFNGTTKTVLLYRVFDANGEVLSGKTYTYGTAPSKGSVRRVTYTFTAEENATYIVTTTNTGCPETDIQLEKNSSATTYNAFQLIEFPNEFVSTIENIQTPKNEGSVTATFSFSDAYNRFIQGNSYLSEEASCNMPTDLLYTSDNKSILQPTAIILNNIPSDIQTKIMQTYADSPIRVSNGVIYVGVNLWNRTADMIEIPSNASIMVSLDYCKS